MFTHAGTTELKDRLNEMFRRQAAEGKIPLCHFDRGLWVIIGQDGFFEESKITCGERAYCPTSRRVVHLSEVNLDSAIHRRIHWDDPPF